MTAYVTRLMHVTCAQSDSWLAVAPLFADVPPLCQCVVMQGPQERDNTLIIHDNCGQQHEARHGNDDYTSSLQPAHEPVGGALACQCNQEAKHKH